MSAGLETKDNYLREGGSGREKVKNHF